MVLDPETGLTLKQMYEFFDKLIDDNMDNITALKEAIDRDFDVPDNVLDEIVGKIEREEQLSPNDIRTLARAVGMDYELLTSDKLADDFTDRFINAVNALIAIRKQYAPSKPEVQDGLQNN